MNLLNFKTKAVLIQVAGTIIYVILIFLATAFYTGGIQSDPSVPGYSFWQNTLSDSGRAVAHSGIPNTISMALFSTALVIYALSYMPFYLVISEVLNEDKKEKLLSKVGTLLGVVASITLIGIAFPPPMFYTYHTWYLCILDTSQSFLTPYSMQWHCTSINDFPIVMPYLLLFLR